MEAAKRLTLDYQARYMNMNRKFYTVSLSALAMLLTLGCSDNEVMVGDLNLSIKLLYKGEPLVMFQDYEYPDGRTINFSKFSMYTSDVKLDDITMSDVAFHNLTDSHIDLSGATLGYQWMINEIEPNIYSNLTLGVGVNESQNAKDPGVFESGHPLAKPAEHWFGWGSFIFLKLEANMDSNGDGIKDLPIALHLGDDAAYRLVSLDKKIIINSNEITESNINIDLFEFLGGVGNTYDVDSNPQIHSLGQQDAVLELADNIPVSFN